MHWERSSPRCTPHTLCSHSNRRHTHQPHMDCISSLQRQHSAQHCTLSTLSKHHCPNQHTQHHRMCSWSTQQQSTDQTHTLHMLSMRPCRHRCDQQDTLCSGRLPTQSTDQDHTSHTAQHPLYPSTCRQHMLYSSSGPHDPRIGQQGNRCTMSVRVRTDTDPQHTAHKHSHSPLRCKTDPPHTPCIPQTQDQTHTQSYTPRTVSMLESRDPSSSAHTIHTPQTAEQSIDLAHIRNKASTDRCQYPHFPQCSHCMQWPAPPSAALLHTSRTDS